MLQRILIVVVLQVVIGPFVVPRIIADEIDAQGLYKKHCVTGNSENGKGKTDLGERLAARDLPDKEFQDSITDERIIEQIINGTEEKMFPILVKLTKREIKSLISDVRAHCVACHGEDGKGTPDLREKLGARYFTNAGF